MALEIPDPTGGAPIVLGTEGTADPIANPTPEQVEPKTAETQPQPKPTGTETATPPADPQLQGLTKPGGKKVGDAEPPKETKVPSAMEDFSQQEWLAWMIEDQKKNGAYDLSREELQNLPQAAKMALAQLAFQGQKTKEALEGREKKVEGQLGEAKKVAEEAARSKASALDWVKASGLKKLIEDNELKPGETPDPLELEGAKKLAKAEAASLMKQFLKTIEDDRDAAQKLADAAAAKQAEDAKVADVVAYANKHAADFDNDAIYADITAELKETPGLTIQKAHQNVMNRRLLADLQARRSEDLEQSRKNITRPKIGSPEAPEVPEEYFEDGEKLIDFFTRNKDAAKRYNERMRAQGLKL